MEAFGAGNGEGRDGDDGGLVGWQGCFPNIFWKMLGIFSGLILVVTRKRCRQQKNKLRLSENKKNTALKFSMRFSGPGKDDSFWEPSFSGSIVKLTAFHHVVKWRKTQPL